ncbi:RidA family protein [Yoonia maritima]|uniref:RidA family protein n=1 Tax=Yoonia maritima TaxID=1435347 RepID=UPI000D10F6E2|nr:RidA family protein [Yoonia maritima]
MAITPVIPPAFQTAYEQIKMSPGVISGGHLFLTGMTGGDPDGQMPSDPATQMRNAFDKIGLILSEANLPFAAIAEMTTYHIGLRDHFALFDQIRLEYLQPPYPAWTAIEAAGLRREGAIIEIRVVANVTASGAP